MTLPNAAREYLNQPSLEHLWARVRTQLERTGHRTTGSVRIALDEDGADALQGILGRSVSSGTRTVSLAELDTALLGSVAERGLLSVVAELTGSPLRDIPAEKNARRVSLQEMWSQVEVTLAEAGLASEPWVRTWIEWLHRSGTLTRVIETTVAEDFRIAAQAIAVALNGYDSQTRMLAKLASSISGDAHALDHGKLAGALAVRGLCFALDVPEPTNPRERIAVWSAVGITADSVSGTVMTWSLRPPGNDDWSAMMRTRADIGLVTHLTLRELASFSGALTESDAIVSGCENPQVLQSIADSGIDCPVVCFSGSPSNAGSILADRIRLRYHGDFDWPGIAITGRMISGGAESWRMNASDYLDAVNNSRASIPLTGSPISTPWDVDLEAAMKSTGVAIHEESLIDALIANLT